MTLRLLLGFAVVAHILILVACTANSEASSTSSASAKSQGSSSNSSAQTASRSSSKVSSTKCRRVKKCPKNEEFSYCPQSIGRIQNCLEKGKTFKYPTSDTTSCKQGCVCKEDYLRSENGTCIPADQCEITCGAYELLDTCPVECDADYCPTEENTEPCITPAECPPPACKCQFNYRRDYNGDCIPTTDCPPFDCSERPNEEYNPCPPICPSDDCSQASPTGECPKLFGRIGIVLPCNPKCRCIKNYWRLNGICVPYEQCPGVTANVCPPNEEFSECAQATCRAQNCTQIGRPIACPSVAEGSCIKSCVCKENYLRNESGDCVPQDECPTNVCPPNEEFSECAQATCRAQNCTQLGQPIACPSIAEDSCIKECVCKESYLRDENGDCVPQDECPTSVCPPNEEFSECAQATCRAQNCMQLGQPIACPSIAEDSCIKECVCKESYLRDENGDCVPQDECPTEVCPANERYSSCIQGECRALNCTQKDQSVPCIRIDPTYCEKGCVCEEGYLREEGGTCVLESQCETNVCPPNQEFSECAQATCRAQNCTQIGRPIACPSIDEGSCIKACVCKESYLRDESGDCIPQDECPTPITCGENEVMDNSDCPSECTSDYCPKSADEEQSCEEIYPCEPTCKCKFNYRRADNGTCIPTKSCPPFDCSERPNEKYDPCPAYCPTDNCSLARVKGICPYKIGVILECNPKCQCKDGYGRVNGICVSFSKCPNLCPANEEYSPCIQETCRPQVCADRDDDMTECSAVEADSCERGCVCQEGYYRNDEGNCISYDECGGPLCPWPNEHYTKTMVPCPPNICRSLVSKYICDDPQVEEPGCLCDSGYLRPNLTAQCIPICECPEMKSSPDC